MPISSIKPGDQVIAYDQATQTTGVYTVTATWAHNDGEVEYLTIGGEMIRTTPQHPFYTEDRGWVAAGDLRDGERVRAANGEFVPVIYFMLLTNHQKMFNLTVDHAHTYFVGTNHILVHNSCRGRDTRLKGGKKAQRDPWYGHSEKAFQRWFHREWKAAGDPQHASRAEINEAYDEWKRLGKP